MKKLRITIFTAVLFFLVTIPFRRLFHLMQVTEVRPVGAFPPVFGLLFGVPGALGCAVGNLAADILSGYSPLLCAAGFIAQFLYGLLPFKMWYGGNRKEEEPHFNNLHQVLKYIWIICLDSLLMAVVLGMMMQAFGISGLFSQTTLLLFFNNLVFSLILGIPMIIIMRVVSDRNRQRVLTLNVRFVLIFLLFSVISAALTGVISYGELCLRIKDPMTLWNRIYIYISVNFFALYGITVPVLWYLERNITIPVEKLTKIASSYAADYAGKRKKERRGDCTDMIRQCSILGRLHGEPGYLAAAYGKMMSDMERYIESITRITAEKERIRTELEVASRMQADMLPESFDTLAEHGEFLIHAQMTPAKEMGGDFYDFFLLDSDHLAFLIADVSGKGVPAALFMVVSKTLLHNQAINEPEPAQAFTAANRALYGDNKNGMFVTAWMGVLTISTGKLTFVNAGHNRPLLRQSTGAYSFVEERSGFVLAGMEDTKYRQEEIRLRPGDTVFLYTDGVTEANNKNKQLYGDERLEKILNKNSQCDDPGILLSAVREDVITFQGEEEQFDDMTMLALCYKGDGFQKNTGAADIARLDEIMAFVDEILKEAGYPRSDGDRIRITADEIYSNICYYSKAEHVTVAGKALRGKGTDREVIFFFEDDGIPYNPLERQEPDVAKSLSQRKVGGLGIYMVKKLMAQISYEYLEGHNRLTVLDTNTEKEREHTVGSAAKQKDIY